MKEGNRCSPSGRGYFYFYDAAGRRSHVALAGVPSSLNLPVVNVEQIGSICSSHAMSSCPANNATLVTCIGRLQSWGFYVLERHIAQPSHSPANPFPLVIHGASFIRTRVLRAGLNRSVVYFQRVALAMDSCRAKELVIVLCPFMAISNELDSITAGV